MNFQQLRYVRETVRQGLNLTEAANRLFTSQPGVSKQIRELEDELGVEIFVRNGKRVVAVTPPGTASGGDLVALLGDPEARVRRRSPSQVRAGTSPATASRISPAVTRSQKQTMRPYSGSALIRSAS